MTIDEDLTREPHAASHRAASVPLYGAPPERASVPRLRTMLLACGLSALLGGVYVWKYPGVLFLGDGWIFLQYARNLATGHGWSFNAGETSFGATSPAWVFMLAALFTIAPAHFDIVAQVAGLVCFSLAAGVLLALLAAVSGPQKTLGSLLWVGVAAVALVPFSGLFYAISAMETGIYLLAFLVFLLLLQRQLTASRIADVWFGLLSGVLFLIRPEAIVCAPLYLLALRERAGQWRRVVSVVFGTGLVAGPWQWFTRLYSGYWLPTSGTGRLFGRLYLVFPDVSLNDYARLAILGRLELVPTVVKTQFVAHPVMMLFVLLPFGVVLGKWAACVWKRKRDPMLGFLAGYCTLVLGAYVIWQPLLFQRYFIAFLPAAVVGTFRDISALRLQRLLVAVGAIFIAAMNVLAVRYYKDHVEMNSAVVELFRSPELQTKPSCRLAAEPLGYAGYFTSCYVIDLGGLINPDIWEYWKAGRSRVDYALDHGADFIVGDALDPERFRLIDQKLVWGLYAVRHDRRP